MRILAARPPRRIALRAALLAGAMALCCLPSGSAWAQAALTSGLTQQHDPNANMVVKAKEMVYDNDQDNVTAVGEVQIYYDGRTLQADRVIYDRKTDRVHATGNVKVTEADGTITYADTLELTRDFHDGFVNALRVVTTDQTYLAATRSERTAGNVTVFQNGVYTACVPCMEHPEKPPLWQIKAVRIIHNEQEKMIYFEDAHFEFLGMPIAYLPYMSSPDPTVKRKSGVLAPSYIYSSDIGYGVKVPYFFNLAPNYDLTLTPGFTTRQGPEMEALWRQRLLNGSYSISASGVYQMDPGVFSDEGKERDFRGAINSVGEFWLNERWKWGWNVTLLSDKYYLNDYSVDLDRRQSDITSTLYLIGQGDKSWFEARSYYFNGLTSSDVQKQLPIVAPVIDYDYIVDHPVFGGELGWNLNLTSLTRTQAAFAQILNGSDAACDGTAAGTTRANCVQRGIDGTYTRASANIYWKRTFTDPLGQQWTPFAYVRADVGWTQLDSGTTQFIDADQAFAARAVPAIGLEYRYPFIAQMSWGSQVIEPIAQVILRPKAAQTGQFPNEDSQSLLYDDTNLFQWDKSSGFDRLEDGSRVNAGVQYTLTTNGGAYFNALFGQSYSFGGTNPYNEPDMANVGLESGLDTNVADYVARVQIQPMRDLVLTSNARFDESDWAMKQLQVSAISMIGPLKADISYGRIAAQPLLGLEDREGVRAKISAKISDHWLASLGTEYDIDSKRFSSRSVALTYIDECIALGLQFANSYDDVSNKYDTSVKLQLNLRGLTQTGTPQEFNDKIMDTGFTKY
ncbi:LPS-assembly protein LptD [Labrys wisconsinensis]|uniref:LPS-assembly protein LptD n=1 Tax=Labrys wisconsinensis TaxID=425677 RepID=A0ABU0J228_9HYPH|nr:LPS-assembly protein LptD [Labrys wisconsinensis]MDQ0468310.1 LPS-assembly protein [Labrys wisconsinensis]